MQEPTTLIAVIDDYQEAASRFADWNSLPSQAKTVFFRKHVDDVDELVRQLSPFQVICLMRERTKIDQAVIARLPNLKLIVTTGMRNAALDIESATRAGITVCGTDAGHSGTPELIWLHILALARNFPGEHAALQRGQWQTSVGRDLNGARLGIVGLGRIGQQVAQVASAFQMQVNAWSPNLTEERAQAAGTKYVDKKTLFSTSDFIVLALQLRDSTRGVVGRDDIARMHRNAFLINTARAGLVDEQALIEALREGRIAGAGIDAFTEEPLPKNHPYRSLANVVITPHIGYVTEATYRLFFQQTVENIHAWMRGRPLRIIS